MDAARDVYQPESLLLKDAYMGNRDVFARKLEFLAKVAEPKQWDYNDPVKEPNLVLKNYLYYT